MAKKQNKRRNIETREKTRKDICKDMCIVRGVRVSVGGQGIGKVTSTFMEQSGKSRGYRSHPERASPA